MDRTLVRMYHGRRRRRRAEEQRKKKKKKTEFVILDDDEMDVQEVKFERRQHEAVDRETWAL